MRHSVLERRQLTGHVMLRPLDYAAAPATSLPPTAANHVTCIDLLETLLVRRKLRQRYGS